MKVKVKHYHCPVNGWDCPYYSDNPQKCLCTLENPYEDCDDFAYCWDEDDDYVDDDLEIEVDDPDKADWSDLITEE